jgi:periplasmic divalent cation tolerance protein
MTVLASGGGLVQQEIVMETSAFVIVLTTWPADHDAEPFARMVVDERLAACVNILPPMRSIYRWQGAVEHATECQLVMKTTAGCVEDLKTRIAALHPYDVPEILVLSIGGGAERYLDWLRENTRA